MKKIIFTTIFFLLSLQSYQALAKDPNISKVQDFIDKVGNEIIKSANDKKNSPEERKEKIISVIDGAIDAKWIARFVLGKNYRTISDDQKLLFTKLYREFMINTYGPKFQNYNGEKFDVTDIVKQGRFYIAKAEFLLKDSKTAVLISFRIKDSKGKFLILDFIAEGISLIETQRSEFNSAISTNGIDKFLTELEDKIKKLK